MGGFLRDVGQSVVLCIHKELQGHVDFLWFRNAISTSKWQHCVISKLSAASQAFTHLQFVRSESLSCFSRTVTLLTDNFQPQCLHTPFYCNCANRVVVFVSSLLDLSVKPFTYRYGMILLE